MVEMPWITVIVRIDGSREGRRGKVKAGVCSSDASFPQSARSKKAGSFSWDPCRNRVPWLIPPPSHGTRPPLCTCWARRSRPRRECRASDPTSTSRAPMVFRSGLCRSSKGCARRPVLGRLSKPGRIDSRDPPRDPCDLESASARSPSMDPSELLVRAREISATAPTLFIKTLPLPRAAHVIRR
jgi:hypothetical protein